MVSLNANKSHYFEQYCLLANIVDIDECGNNQATCHPSLANCFNTEGSYNCECHLGYEGDGMDCSGIFVKLLPTT